MMDRLFICFDQSIFNDLKSDLNDNTQTSGLYNFVMDYNTSVSFFCLSFKVLMLGNEHIYTQLLHDSKSQVSY